MLCRRSGCGQRGNVQLKLPTRFCSSVRSASSSARLSSSSSTVVSARVWLVRVRLRSFSAVESWRCRCPICSLRRSTRASSSSTLSRRPATASSSCASLCAAEVSVASFVSLRLSSSLELGRSSARDADMSRAYSDHCACMSALVVSSRSSRATMRVCLSSTRCSALTCAVCSSIACSRCRLSASSRRMAPTSSARVRRSASSCSSASMCAILASAEESLVSRSPLRVRSASSCSSSS